LYFSNSSYGITRGETITSFSVERCTIFGGSFNKRGKYGGGTFAHPDIALEFASWIDTAFNLLVIPLKDFTYNVKKHFEGISFEGLY